MNNIWQATRTPKAPAVPARASLIDKALTFSKPSFSIEKSRSQVLCRTGLRDPGQSVALKFGPAEKYLTIGAAVSAANKWKANATETSNRSVDGL